MSAQTWFVTGTDTGVGKTVVTCLLLRYFAGHGLRVAGYKPVAAGAEWVDGQWRNDDAVALRAASTVPLAYSEVNPFCLSQPCSPHLAARADGVTITIDDIEAPLRALQTRSEVLLVEGAGGWRVPLDDREDLAGLAMRCSLPVLLVVGVRLGCINHARLSAEAILADGLVLDGWIANVLEPDLLGLERVLATLERAMPTPRLATIAWADAECAELQWSAEGQSWAQRIVHV